MSVNAKIGALKLSSVHIPALVQRGTNFWLACQFELEPGEQLYSVKWYKDNQEFYRLQAAEHLQPPMQVQANSNTDGQQQQQYFSQSGLNVMVSCLGSLNSTIIMPHEARAEQS